MSNRERQVISLLAVDDDPGVLSSYQALFERSRRQGDMDQLEALLNEGSGSSGEDERVERRFPFEFDLDTITQGSEGPALAQQKPYSVALLDMRMPGGWDGLKTAMALHQQDPRIRIILITAFMDYSLDDLRGQLGTNFAYLQKPFDTNELIQLVLLLSHDWLREQQLMEAEQKALRASQSKDDFLASMSHELRTPLTALLGNCDLMGETSLTTSQSELLSSMEVSGKSLLYLINDILDNSKIESGRFDIDEVEYNPLLLIKELREIFSIRASETGILFEVEIENDFERMLVGDGRRLSQVLINLLGNALKFTSEGSVRLTIRMDRPEQQLHLTTTDSGIGMSAEALGRLFRPYEQANSTISGRFGGTGLGLHISWNLVELMGGTIVVSSEEGRGSTFAVVIPLKEGAVLSENDIERSREAPPKLALQGRVLIAEDTPELQMLERRMVEAHGAEVEFAKDGQEALEKGLAEGFDLILMDMQMMDGIEATSQLRALGVSTPIVALTANVMQKQRDQFFAAGCDGFLSKPIDRVELRSTLERYLPLLHEKLGQPPAEDSPASGADSIIDDELMLLFVERCMVMREELMVAYGEGSWSQVRNTAHTIKGSGTTFGYPELTALGDKVQKAVDEKKLERAEELVIELNRALKGVG